MGEEAGDEKAGAGMPSGALALGAASRERADAWLEEQTRLTRLQIARERKDDRLRDWQLFVSTVSGVMKLAFEAVIALLLIVIATALGAALWSAAHDDGLVIEAFSVPPDLAGRGLTGEVVAARVLDRLSALQDQTNSNRAASSYVNNWGDDIKVQIPETGVSIGQLYRYLVQWLGDETHISGEITREAAGLAVTARVGGQPAATVRGKDDALGALIQQAAEAVYRRTQPYRYAVYLDNHGRGGEAQAIYRALLAGNSTEDRAWAYIGLASERSTAGDLTGADVLLHRALGIKPNLVLAYSNLSNNESSLQHDEKAMAYARQALAAGAGGSADSGMGAADFERNMIANHLTVVESQGDANAAVAFNRELEALGDDGVALNARQADVGHCALLYDRDCFTAAIDAVPEAKFPASLNMDANLQQSDLQFADWRGSIAHGDSLATALLRLPGAGAIFLARSVNPFLALAHAELGEFQAADALIDRAPPDCAQCLRLRGTIAGLEHRWAAADIWFARATAAAPSLPFAYGDWGDILLRKGDTGGAIAKLSLAVARGPHYFPAMELWGEALMLGNRSDLALAKFADAAREAPRWGRLRLKWGEALFWLGRKDEARAQFAVGATLFLTPADRATRAHMQALK